VYRLSTPLKVSGIDWLIVALCVHARQLFFAYYSKGSVAKTSKSQRNAFDRIDYAV